MITKSERIREIARGAVVNLYTTAPPSERYADRVTQFLCMVWAHESNGGRYARQMGFAPDSNRGAAGEFQMEAAAVARCIAWLKMNSAICLRAGQYAFDDPFQIPNWIYYLDTAEAYKLMVLSDKWAATLARVYLLQFTAPIPAGIEAQSIEAKRIWNTAAGKATPEQYRRAFVDCFGAAWAE